jgi:hypothetical protein
MSIEDDPHAVNWTHAEEVNAALAKLLARFERSSEASSPPVRASRHPAVGPVVTEDY